MPTPAWEWVSVNTSTWYPAELHNYCGASNPASTAWPTANLALYLPFFITARTVVQRVWWVNGATASGNVDIGIYNEAGTTKLFSAGSTAQGTISVVQSVSASSLLLTPGRYWMGFAFDNTTATTYRWTLQAGASNVQKLFGMQQQTTAFPLPSSTTFAQCTNSFIPMIGLYLSTLTM